MNQEEIYKIRHSCAHLLASAVKDYFKDSGKVAFGTGPATEEGFYYDFLLPRSLKEEDLPKIEKVMKKRTQQKLCFIASEKKSEQLALLFQNQPFKKEIIHDILSKNSDAILTTYTIGEFTDLCQGPHVNSTEDIDKDAIKLLSFSSVYWKGDNQKATLTRIYGTAWKTPEELAEYLWQRTEAEKRDHRKIGKQLSLFHFDETSPGAPYWLPNGLVIFHELLKFCRHYNKQNRYMEISSPLINKKSLWQTSGHWEFYRDDMYLVTTYGADMAQDEKKIELALKPMNCPNAMVVFNIKRRSYRELPLRLSDCDMLHRNEASGALHGLLRVRQFHQDDAHIFLKEDQIEKECQQLLKMCQNFYDAFTLHYTFRLGTRPEAYIGSSVVWDKAEEVLKKILNAAVGEGNYSIAEGEGAFYGPKIDILMKDSLKRVWQMGTIQLDFQLPARFNCQYVDEDGQFKTPVVIHRAIYGSLERFIGILIEDTAGNLPVWLAPVQVAIIPIADRHLAFCQEKLALLEKQDIRCFLDERSERMNTKIRDAEMQKIPYLVIIGDKEMESNQLSCRFHDKQIIFSMNELLREIHSHYSVLR